MPQPSTPSNDHKIWTEQRIGEFWDVVAKEPRFDRLYFGRIVADPLTQLVGWFVQQRRHDGRPDPVVLDYGCGPGYLTQSLVNAGITTAAMEFSAGSVAATNDRCGRDADQRFRGCTLAQSLPTPLPSSSFDIVISTEAYEHLRDEWINGYFAELARLCRPSGFVIVTTPMQETLDDNLCACPMCHATFHRWGHLRSADPDRMRSDAAAAGLDVVWTGAVRLDWLSRPVGLSQRVRRWGDASIKDAIRAAIRTVRTTRNRIAGAPPWKRNLEGIPGGPHLILIARR